MRVEAAHDVPLTVSEAAGRLRTGDLSSVELTQAMLRRADEIDKRIGAYAARFDERALEAAARADRELASGLDRGPFHGIPVAIKDIIAVADGPTRANSLILDPAWGEGREGLVIARLRAAGAVITGKTTTMEFAFGFTEPDAPFPIPRNPWNLGHWPGGTSSGTAGGIAAGLFLAGIGTDTGGSIRLPSAFCGLSGLKPTFGLVPKSGCVPLGFSLDHIGPIARSVRDCAAFLDIIAGHDPSDESSVDRPAGDYVGALTRDLAGIRIGVDPSLIDGDGADPALRGCFEGGLDVLRGLGAAVVEVTLPLYAEMEAASMIAIPAEGFAYHRNDLRDRWNEYMSTTRTRLALGALVSAPDYVQAQRMRRLAQRRLVDLFTSVDLVATPTALIGAPRLEDAGAPGFARQIRTRYWNLAGNPALALPMGLGADGLPLSLQLAAAPFAEATLCRAGDAYQVETDWHLRKPTFETPSRSAASAAPTPSPAVSEEKRELARSLLARAGVTPGADELAVLASYLDALETGVRALYNSPDARYESPSVSFDPAPRFVDWGCVTPTPH
jgi:aspartyl-tRNA(Asn)/glutamyl-tRNA(Gln) amidotransferase subunit A